MLKIRRLLLEIGGIYQFDVSQLYLFIHKFSISIAKVAIGDQPPDIEEQIRSMCLKYITNPNAIILAVTGANTDLANSDALQLARYVDPNGDRTIGVLTKLDLMDPGTDASDILSNKLIPLQKGYIGMINRGQADIDNNLTIREGLKKEMQFFNSHPAYRNLHQKCGTRNLSKNLNSILMHHIKDCLPELKSKISSMIHDLNLELQSLGMPSSGEGTSNEAGMLLTLLSKFTANFSNCIDGRGNLSGNNNFETNEVYGGARISFIFNQVFVRSLMSIQPFDGLTDEEIRTTICNANGTRTSLFVPEISFDILVKKQISRLEQPGLQCVDLVFDELQKIASQCEPSEFTRFPNLREQMVEVVSSLLRRCVQPTQMMVSNLIKIELSYINTSHPDFIGGSKAVAKLMEKMSREEEKNKNNPNGMDSNMAGYQSPFHSGSRPTSTTSTISNTNGFKDAVEHDLEETDNNKDPKEREGGALMNFIFEGKKDNTSSNSMNKTRSAYGDQNSGPPSIIQLPQVPSTMRQPTMPTDREKIETEIIKSLIYSYFSIIRKNFIDMVPKTIMYFLVNHARDSMQNELVKELYKDKLVPDLMQEAEDIAQRRRTCGEMRDLLNKALEIVNEVRDFNTFK